MVFYNVKMLSKSEYFMARFESQVQISPPRPFSSHPQKSLGLPSGFQYKQAMHSHSPTFCTDEGKGMVSRA